MAKLPRPEPQSPSAEDDVFNEESARLIAEKLEIPFGLRFVHEMNAAAYAYLNDKQTHRYVTTTSEKNNPQVHTVEEQRRLLGALQER